MHELTPEKASYKIETLIGEGLTASVYKAIRCDSRGLSRQVVAVKILKNQTEISDLRREFEVLAQVSSPHCVRVLAWENLPKGSALILEWINGATLLELARSMSFDSELRDEVVAQVQDGLAALQRCGLHHGDLNPRNILIDREGTVKLLDFASASLTGQPICGTPAYLAPEIYEGQGSSLAADFFALGMIATDLLEHFHDVPQTLESARARCARVAGLSSGDSFALLHREPEKRFPLSIASRAEVKARLARQVREWSAHRESALIATARQVLSKSKKFGYEHLVSSIAAIGFLVMVSAPVRAEAPLAKIETPAQLSVRSQSWLEIEVDGRARGYAPVEIKALRPGIHHLSWRGPRGHGELQIALSPGEKKLILGSSLVTP